MKGQWIGGYSSAERSGLILVDADETTEGYEVQAILDIEKPLPHALVYFRTPSHELGLPVTTAVQYVIGNGQTVPAEVMRKQQPGLVFPSVTTLVPRFDGEDLRLTWTTDAGQTGQALLPPSEASGPSELLPQELSWETFKNYVSKLPYRSYVYRGQEKPWRLRTGFHRTGRANLGRFLNQDLLTLHRHLSGRTRHYFNLNNSDEQGAFLNLIQHHGYPTPVLDFTYSPYVAAYFAFANLQPDAMEGAKVRIFTLNKEACVRALNPVPSLRNVGPHFSILEFSSVENERMVPQQAVSAVSSIDDIETYLLNHVAAKEAGVLSCVDLPASDREHVMQDLRLMGITAGSLFPGLDGACKELRELFF